LTKFVPDWEDLENRVHAATPEPNLVSKVLQELKSIAPDSLKGAVKRRFAKKQNNIAERKLTRD
jgi:hypothetical protein